MDFGTAISLHRQNFSSMKRLFQFTFNDLCCFVRQKHSSLANNCTDRLPGKVDFSQPFRLAIGEVPPLLQFHQVNGHNCRNFYRTLELQAPETFYGNSRWFSITGTLSETQELWKFFQLGKTFKRNLEHSACFSGGSWNSGTLGKSPFQKSSQELSNCRSVSTGETFTGDQELYINVFGFRGNFSMFPPQNFFSLTHEL